MMRLLREPEHLMVNIERPRPEKDEIGVEYRKYKDYTFSEDDFLVEDWIRAGRLLPDFLVDAVRIIYEQETLFDGRYESEAFLLEQVSIQTSRGYGTGRSYRRTIDESDFRWKAFDKCGNELPRFKQGDFEYKECLDWRVLGWKYYEPFPLEEFSYEYFDKHPNGQRRPF